MLLGVLNPEPICALYSLKVCFSMCFTYFSLTTRHFLLSLLWIPWREYAVHLISRTNLILLVVVGRCNGHGNKERISIKPSEVHYDLEEDLENMTVHNEVVAQICRVPIVNLERKKPTTTCYDYNKRVKRTELLYFSQCAMPFSQGVHMRIPFTTLFL